MNASTKLPRVFCHQLRNPNINMWRNSSCHHLSSLVPQPPPKNALPRLRSNCHIVQLCKKNSTLVGTFGDVPTSITEEDRQFVVEEPSPEDLSRLTSKCAVRPVVVVFGWAGCKHKNLDKYSRVYRSLGCTTLQYILPTRFIFRYTEQIPSTMTGLAEELSQRLATQTPPPLLVHSLSDTGVMSFQGLEKAAIDMKSPLHISGIVWDSCPGPRPVVTIPKGLILCAINWLSRMRDGMSFGSAVSSSYKDFIDLAWNNYIRRLKGRECLLSLMDNTWCGHWARDLDTKGPELFLFSENDVYIPCKWLKEEVIPAREKGRDVTALCWPKSTHVAHIKDHPDQYQKQIQLFINKVVK